MLSLDLADPSLWEWRQAPQKALTDSEVVAASEELLTGWMPSQIHCELLAQGEIPDPFLKLNEQDVQWVGETDWLYRCTFDGIEAAGDSSGLVFEGLDTFATVWLNGNKILECDNMFTPHRVTVGDKLKTGANVLLILFTSSFIKGRVIEEEHLGPDKHLALWNGDPSRLWVRKAGYEYGWDWGPCLCSAGPWKPIRLETYTTRITDFNPKVIVTESLQATLTLDVTTSSFSQSLSTNFTLLDPSGAAIRKFVTEQGSLLHSSTCTFGSGEVELWWSVGLGSQPLYTVKAELFASDGTVLDSQTKKIGFRRLRVVQEPLLDQPGTSFCFEVNNVPIFCGGSNWIPIDAFIVNATRERYRAWLELLVAGHQNMIRAWGGGVYEHDDFYDLCDELGILVWQDFQFGCGQYPAHPAFIASVKAEAEANVFRIRHHASLAIFAGNNEDYQVAESMNLEYDPKDHHGDWSTTTFPAREIYERTLPEVVHRLCDVYYHPGWPWGGKDTRDPTVGDIHQWNVWHGSQQQYQDWDQLGGRFVSEFGMQGLPDVRTIDYFLDGDTSERYSQSKTIGYHNKADGYERRLELYLVENIRHAFDLESYIYATQLVQAETLSTAYRLWRREFKGPGRAYCAGALVWQLNDVYPCTSWSIVDYFLRPKPAYYSIKQSMTPIAVGMKRYTERIFPEKHSVAVFEEKHYVEIWVANSTLAEKKVEVVVEGFELLTGKRIYGREGTATLGSNRSTELEKIEVPISSVDSKAAIIVSTKLVDPETKEVLSRFSTYPEPYKFLTFPTEDVVRLQVIADVVKGALTISAATPVKGLILSFDSDVTLSDNALDLLPGDERVILVKGLADGTKVSWRHLGDKHVP